MAEKHLIVFGENAEQQLKNNLDNVKSFKEAAWLYDGILYREGVQTEDMINILFRDPKFAPTAIIDNNKWLCPQQFANNPNIWKAAISQCFAMTSREHIQCYSYFD